MSGLQLGAFCFREAFPASFTNSATAEWQRLHQNFEFQRSLSTIKHYTETDCTRPADNPPLIFLHKTEGTQFVTY